jgi:hypothetical protein
MAPDKFMAALIDPIGKLIYDNEKKKIINE